MPVFYSEVQERHDPAFFLVRGRPSPSPERASRGPVLLAAALAQGLEHMRPEPASDTALLRVHSPDYLAFLAAAWPAWQAAGGGTEVIPNTHPSRAHTSYPSHIVGRAGWHLGDTACPIGCETFIAARAAAGSALAAATAIADGGSAAYALCRPPGHHAFADMAAGFCFLNNTAVAAADLAARGLRPAILDIDVHHGNGTQAIFYGRADLLHLSIHADPANFYPWFWGYAHERGEGPGEGWNVNLPLPLGTTEDRFLDALDHALERIHTAAPDVLIVALGLDIHEGDPLAAFHVTTDGFARIGERIGHFAGPTLVIQEGGYPSAQLGANLGRFLEGFLARRRAP